MKNITIITGTRAEYGLLKNIIKEVQESKKLKLNLIVTGTHLKNQYGNTVEEIKEDGIKNFKAIDILLDIDNETRISKEISNAIYKFSDEFLENRPDILMVLGDRYEIFAACIAAMGMNIPIAHIAGGEVTEGAIDDQIRHAITKMAHIHFPGAELYKENILNMGEESKRVFNVGDSGIENIKLTKLMSKKELEKSLNFELNEKLFLVTYHPVTLDLENTEFQIQNLLYALEEYKEFTIIITYPNSDTGSKIIIDAIEKFSEKNKNVKIIKSLGSLRYLSILNISKVVIGNSSSALIEAPYLKKAVINIGDRQKGRLKAKNIIDCGYGSVDIIKAIQEALTDKFQNKLKNIKSLYGEGNTSKEIRRILEEIELDKSILSKKLVWEDEKCQF